MSTSVGQVLGHGSVAAEPCAVRWTRHALAGMFIAGAAGHAVFASVTPEIYEAFADGAPFVVVREAWRELFVPHARVLAGALAVFELGLGVLLPRGDALRSGSRWPARSPSMWRWWRLDGGICSGACRCLCCSSGSTATPGIGVRNDPP